MTPTQRAAALRLADAIDDDDYYHRQAAALLRELAAEPAQEPVAWMWTHDETGRVGFVDQWQLENGWEKTNPRLHVTTPLYAHQPLRAEPVQEPEPPLLAEIATLRERLAQFTPLRAKGVVDADALYAAPQQRRPLTDDFVYKVVRSVQPNLDDTCKAWGYEFAQCKYWLDAAHGITGETP